MAQNIYRKLQQKLDELPIGFPPTESGVEIKILEYLFTPEEAQIALKLEMFLFPVDKISKKLKGLDLKPADLEAKLDEMTVKGSINRIIRRNGQKLYGLAFLAIGIFEFQIDRLTKEFYQLFREYLEEAFRDEILSTRIPQLRTVPIEGAITPDLPIMPYDRVREIITNDDREIVVAECICKKGQDLVGKPCKVTKEREICLIFGSSSRRFEQLGWGRRIDKEECFKILDRAEKDGLVVQPSNTEKLFAICLCCGCCCEILTSAKPLENPVQYFASNYRAVVDTDECIGCGVCVQRCQMDAVHLEDGISVVDYTRCIGCGVCVPTCASEAMTLERKPVFFPPPENAVELYKNIMRKKMGNARYMLMVTKKLLKSKL